MSHCSLMLCRGLVFLAAFLLASAARGQTPLDSLGALVRDGHLTVEADLQPGRILMRPAWTLEVEGTPRARIQAEAREGRVEKLDFSVQGGRLIVRGQGLRPKVTIESLHFDSRKGITGLSFHGLGIWRPIVAIFGGIARSAVGKLEFRTDVPSVLRGQIFGAPSAFSAQAFLDVLREARIVEMTLTAFEGRSVVFPPFLEFRTAAHSETGKAFKLDVDRGVFRPGHGGEPDFFEFAGRLEGEFEAGAMSFGKDRAGFSCGRIEGGSFQAKNGEDGNLETAVAASRFSLELSSGHLEVPGGLGVDLAEGSRFAVADLRVAPSGLFSGVVDLDLAGRTGAIAREGARLSATGVSVRASGLRVTENRASGPAEVSFDYFLKYTLVVHYPIKGVPEKRVPLDFHGPFVARLELSDAGAEGGEVRGDYSFKAPWPPIETAALETLAAKWTQDVVIGNVNFTLAPKRFRPCGNDCFLLGFAFTAEKKKKDGSFFRQYCEPQGRANLFLDKQARAFILRDVRVQTHCRGVVGWVANLVAPLLAKTYSETVLFRMPEDLPLTIEHVQAGAEWITIAGDIDWKTSAVRPSAGLR